MLCSICGVSALGPFLPVRTRPGHQCLPYNRECLEHTRQTYWYQHQLKTILGMPMSNCYNISCSKYAYSSSLCRNKT